MFLRAWPVLLGISLTSLPWALMIHLRESDFWQYFFWEEHIRRFFADNAQHPEPAHFFIMLLPGLALPWLALIPATLVGLHRSDAPGMVWRSPLRLLWLWMILPFLFFSASQGKLATYILPCFPPLAALIAVGLSRCFGSGHCRAFDFGVAFNALFLGALLLALIVSQGFDVGFRAFTDGEEGKAVLTGIALALGVVLSLSAWISRRPLGKWLTVLLSVAPLLLASHFTVPEVMIRERVPGVLLERYAGRIGPDTLLVADGEVVRAVGWHFKRDDIYLSSPQELEYGLSYPDAAGRLLDWQGFAELLRHNAGRRPVVWVCKDHCDGHMARQLPAETERESYGVFTIWWIPATG